MNYEHYIYQMQKVLEMKGCTEGSKRVYRYTMLRFLTYLNKPVEKISTEDITNYLRKKHIKTFETDFYTEHEKTEEKQEQLTNPDSVLNLIQSDSELRNKVLTALLASNFAFTQVI